MVKEQLKRKSKNHISKTCLKGILLAGLFFQSLGAHAIEIKWHGASCITMEDESTRVIIDPFVSRPSWFKVLTNSELTSQTDLVKRVFAEKNKKDTFILITHTHYDHVLDLGSVAKMYPKAKIIGPKNIKALGTYFKIDNNRLQIVNGGEKIVLGSFQTQAYNIEHSKLPLGISFARGEISGKGKTGFGAFDFKSKESVAYSFIHPEAKILLHPSAEGRKYSHIKEADLLIVGLTSRDLSSLNDQVLSKIKAKAVLPIHHDNFFRSYEEPLTKMPFYPTLNKFTHTKLPLTLNINSRNKTL